MTKVKGKEVEELAKGNSIVCLTETQKKWSEINFGGNFEVLDSMREEKDRKGGGLLMLYNKGKGNSLCKIATNNKDILHTKGKLGKWEVRIILVYFSVNDVERNKDITQEIEKIIEENSEPLIITGDFNGHVGFKGPHRLNRNGEIIIHWMDKYGMIMLNDDERCTGEVTWSRNEQHSVVDYVMVTEEAYKRFHKMRIDEEKDVYDLSDHNLIEVEFRVQEEKREYKKSEWVEREYYKTDKSSLEMFRKRLEEKVVRNKMESMDELEKKMKETADAVLKSVYRRREKKAGDGEEPAWINEEIREEIKERKRLNRNRRNAECIEEEARWKALYLEQKTKVQIKIRKEMYKQEEKITEEIKDKKDGRKKMWEYIRMLKGEKAKDKNTLRIYGEDGVELERGEVEEEIKGFWNGVYRKHRNDIEKVWNTEIKEAYTREYEQIKKDIEQNQAVKLEDINELRAVGWQHAETCGKEVREHMEMARRAKEGIIYLEEESIKEDRVIKCINRMKNKKAVGTDKIKSELYKELAKSAALTKVLVEELGAVLETGRVPEGWRESRTVMLPKTSKPKANELRPIALTNVGYKLMMAVIRISIEEHVRINGISKETQAGFTEGSRIENNLLILRYCVENTYKMRKALIVISVDFAKAYDSVKRDKLIEVLIENKISPCIINFIAGVYVGDRTRIEIGREEEGIEIEATSGIRQGCTASTTLFKLITFKIIQELEKLDCGYKDEAFRISSLFFADDGMLLASSVGEAVQVIEKMETVGKEYGLEINKQKSNIIIFNMPEKPENIKGISVRDRIKYLGITINDKKNCFQVQKEEMFSKARRLANMTYNVIEKSCSRMLIGKTYWKNVALPSILYGVNIIHLNKTDIGKLQRIENGVYRKILRAPPYAQEAALKGEIGASSVKNRIREGQFKYLRHVLVEGNDLVKRVGEEMIEKRQSRWVKEVLNGLRVTEGLNVNVRSETKESIRQRMREVDTREWKKQMEEKSSLKIYRKWRQELGGQEEIYTNNQASQLLFKCRSNTLRLKDRNRHWQEDTRCDMCGAEIEDLGHFLLWCPAYGEERRKCVRLQQPYTEEEDDIVGEFLFDNSHAEETKIIIQKFWSVREKKMKESEEN